MIILKKFGKVISLCMAGVLTFTLLSGCGGKGDSTDKSTSADADYSIEATGSPYAEGSITLNNFSKDTAVAIYKN